MGVTIHYTATLKSPILLPELCNEISELSKEAGWNSTHIGPDNIKMPDSAEMIAEGMLLTIHKKMEPVNLIFDNTGQMINFAYLFSNIREPGASSQEKTFVIDNNTEVKEIETSNLDLTSMSRWASTKSQFAGPGAHVCLCRLLKYLDKKYFNSIEVKDEGEYWESGDMERLVLKMNFINDALDDLDLFLKTNLKEDFDSHNQILNELLNFWKKVSKKK